MARSETHSGKSPLAVDGAHRWAVGGSGLACLDTTLGEKPKRGPQVGVEIHRSVTSLVIIAVTEERRRVGGQYFSRVVRTNSI